MKDAETSRELLLRYLDGQLKPDEEQQVAELLRNDGEAREFLRDIAEQAVVVADLERAREPRREESEKLSELARGKPNTDARTRSAKWPWVLTVAACVAAVTTAVVFWPGRESGAETTSFAPKEIAKITGLSGSLVWTGDGGRIETNLTAGTKLSGGTIEGLAPDSWFELEFNDGSTVMISGQSILTFSDHEQKELRLKEGTFSASVVPQPAGRPMRIRTPSAVLEVLGTRFEVEAGLSSTTLNVTEGKVRVKRLSDGNTVDVSANQRMIAAADQEMSAEQVPDSVNQWKSHLQLGPDDTYGNYGHWSPATDDQPASLKAIPFVPEHKKSVTLYLLGLPVVRSDNSPVIVKTGASFVARGRLETAADVYFGIRVARPNGDFAGMFLAKQPKEKFSDKSEFEAVFPLDSFGLDPCVWDRKDELPEKPDNLVVTGVWSFTHTPGSSSGLELTEVELVPR